MLAGSIMQITCEAAPLVVLGLKEAASSLAQRIFSLAPFPSMDEQRNNQKKLRDDDRDDSNNAPPVLLPRGRYSVFDDTAGWQIALGKSPSFELTPIEDVNTGSRCFQFHLCRGCAAKDLCRRISSYVSGFFPTYNVPSYGASSNIRFRCRINWRCRSSG